MTFTSRRVQSPMLVGTLDAVFHRLLDIIDPQRCKETIAYSNVQRLFYHIDGSLAQRKVKRAGSGNRSNNVAAIIQFVRLGEILAYDHQGG